MSHTIAPEPQIRRLTGLQVLTRKGATASFSRVMAARQIVASVLAVQTPRCEACGQDYVSLMTDLEASRILDVVPGRDEESLKPLWKTLSTEQIDKLEAVCIDMWQAYENSVREHAPQADIVHDRFHISKHLNEAVDKVRRDENKSLKNEGDERLVGTKQLWLYNQGNIRKDRKKEFEELRKQELKTARAWAIKESFRHFWSYCYHGSAENYFHEWYEWAVRSRLKPIAKVAKM